MKKIILYALTLFAMQSAYSDDTAWAEIRQVNYNASADFLFFLTTGQWEARSGGNTSCQPTYVQITNGVLGRDKILSIGLAAHMAGRQVQFRGECNADTNYFNATYIIIK